MADTDWLLDWQAGFNDGRDQSPHRRQPTDAMQSAYDSGFAAAERIRSLDQKNANGVINLHERRAKAA